MTRTGSTVVVGEIAGPHGIAGEVKFRSHLVGNLELAEGTEVILRFPGGGRSARCLIKIRRVSKGLLLTIEDVTDRDSAEKLRGVHVEVDANLLPSAPEGEYYWRDLIGVKVFSKQGEQLGRVVNLLERAGQDLLVLDIGGREAMVPFVEPIVVSVDVEADRLVVDPPEGLLELAGS